MYGIIYLADGRAFDAAAEESAHTKPQHRGDSVTPNPTICRNEDLWRRSAPVAMECPDKSHDLPLVRVFSKGETDFCECQICGLVFRREFPSPSDLESIYQEAYSEGNIERGRTDQESGAFATSAYCRYLLSRYVRAGMRVLDIGAGTGELVMLLRQAGVDAVGVESSAVARDYCESHRGIRLAPDLAALRTESFDVVTMIEVIEHVTDLWGTLSGALRMLKPKGVLFITTPNRKGLRARVEKGFWGEARKKFHLFLFDRSSIAFHLNENGFDRVRVIRFSPIPRSGLKYWLFGRAMQVLWMPGTLCVVARRG